MSVRDSGRAICKRVSAVPLSAMAPRGSQKRPQVGVGGIAAAVSKMCFGNSIGFSLDKNYGGDIFALNEGAIVVELADSAQASEIFAKLVGETVDSGKIFAGGSSIELSELYSAWTKPLEGVFATLAVGNCPR